MRIAVHASIMLLLVTFSDCVVVTGVCEQDVHCEVGSCCIPSLWYQNLRICTPLRQKGEECHPASNKVPFLGQRKLHMCPCSPNLLCSRSVDGKFRCSKYIKTYIM